MPEISVTEGESAAKADYTLTYSYSWSNTAKRGLPVLKTDTAKLFFYVSKTANDNIPWLTLDDSGSSTGITWLDTSAGKIRIQFPATTTGRVGDGQFYELRIKWADNTVSSIESGTFNVKDSVVDI